jgi:hypothetical protein
MCSENRLRSSKHTYLNIRWLKIYLFTRSKQDRLKMQCWKEGLMKSNLNFDKYYYLCYSPLCVEPSALFGHNRSLVDSNNKEICQHYGRVSLEFIHSVSISLSTFNNRQHREWPTNCFSHIHLIWSQYGHITVKMVSIYWDTLNTSHISIPKSYKW